MPRTETSHLQDVAARHGDAPFYVVVGSGAGCGPVPGRTLLWKMEI